MALELWRPVERTEEAAACSAPPVSSRASSSFLPADRPSSSTDCLASLPSSEACSVNVCNVVKVFPQYLESLACACSNMKNRARLAPLRSRVRRTGGFTGRLHTEERNLHDQRQDVHLAEFDSRCAADM